MAEPQAEQKDVSVTDLWIGSSLGILKGICMAKKETLNYLPPGMTIASTDKSREVLCMCWEHQSTDKLYMGLRSGSVECFDCEKKYFMAECNLTGGVGQYVGLGKYEDTLITCTDEGILSFWPGEEDKVEINVGRDTHTMAVSTETPLLVATGGRENMLKLWDGNRPDSGPVFKAKNVANDYLNLRVPVWETAIAMVPGGGRKPCVAVGTGHSHLRLYDTRAKKRPVYSCRWGEAPFTCVDVIEDGRYFLAGNGHGEIVRVDVRKGGVLNKYHGFGGGVKGISCFSNDEDTFFAACGLDRYLRVYSMEPPRVVYKSYLKLQCNAILFKGMQPLEQLTKGTNEEGVAGVKRRSNDCCQGNEDEDDVWEQMEMVAEDREPVAKRKRTRHKRA